MLSRTDTIFRSDYQKIVHRTDRMFFWLLIGQWVGAVLVAVVWSPRTWIAQYWSIHQHVTAAALLGGVFASYPLYLILRYPGTRYTRHMIAIGQMLQSALLVHVSGGRIETHFHVFGSLALLAFYRDWPVLITGSAVVYLDHLALGIWFPLSVYGVLSASVWRSLEHAFWVVFEVTFLTMSCLTGTRELRAIADREVRLEEAVTALQREHAKELAASAALEQRTKDLAAAKENLEVQVQQRTVDLKEANQQLEGKVQELELLNKIMMGREERILELKEQLQALKAQLERSELH